MMDFDDEEESKVLEWARQLLDEGCKIQQNRDEVEAKFWLGPNKFRDFVIHYKGAQFHVHRAILCLKSEYFDGLSDDKLTNEVKLPDLVNFEGVPISSEDFLHFLEAIYSKTQFPLELLFLEQTEDELVHESVVDEQHEEEDNNSPIHYVPFNEARMECPAWLDGKRMKVAPTYDSMVFLSHYFHCFELEKQIDDVTADFVSQTQDITEKLCWEWMKLADTTGFSRTRAQVAHEIVDRFLSDQTITDRFAKLSVNGKIAFVSEMSNEDVRFWFRILELIVTRTTKKYTDAQSAAIKEAVLLTAFEYGLQQKLKALTKERQLKKKWC